LLAWKPGGRQETRAVRATPHPVVPVELEFPRQRTPG